MKMEEVRAIAKSQGLNPGKLSKTGLIKSIQTDEGNFDCFATAYDRRMRSSWLQLARGLF